MFLYTQMLNLYFNTLKIHSVDVVPFIIIFYVGKIYFVCESASPKAIYVRVVQVVVKLSGPIILLILIVVILVQD